MGGQETEVDRGARKRAAVEMIARYEPALRRTAQRYSIDSADAEDAYQRALEIVLTKAPTTDLRELIRWTQTVTKHEALAVRQGRERLLGRRRGFEDGRDEDPVALIPARTDSPAEQAERHEEIARSREALQTLKPAELRALTLLAEGYSYAEIGELTGYTHTKINRLLAEGRERFRSVLASSEDGRRCRELRRNVLGQRHLRQRDRAARRDRRGPAGRARSPRGDQLPACGGDLGLGETLGGSVEHGPASRQDGSGGAPAGRATRLVEPAARPDRNGIGQWLRG